ncbi:prephenate dehydratase [Candidatus Peregrinibacteria bacterium]|nr:prephenate dehydratase [Candidatus Peregrinibacteria bacterium]
MEKKLVGIIGGKGKMGKYFAEFFERNGYDILISDKGTALTNIQLAKKADVVVVSVPIDKTQSVIDVITPHVRPSALLMDLTSLKVFPMEAMKKTRASYLGCHPIFGPTNPIEGQLVVLCPGCGRKWFKWLKDLLVKNKVIVKTLTSQKHDQLMAYVQVLTHFSDIALADTLRKSKIPIREMVTVQSPVYRLELDMMGRILHQDPQLYANIEMDNPLSTQVLEDFIDSCQKLKEIVSKKNGKQFINYFNACSRYLGPFAKEAMVESDRLIREMQGSGVPQNPSPELAKQCDMAVLGPENTYSDIAAKRYDPKAKICFTSSINSIFDLICKGEIKVGFVPLENSLTGSVRETLDELYQENVWIEKVVSLPIHLSLIGIKKVPKKDIKFIYSHPQPFLQSRRYIRKHFPKAACIPVSSTAAALARVAKEKNPTAIAIGSEIAAKTYGLKVIGSSIEDNKTNTTYFAVIRKKSGKLNLKKACKTSIAFHFSKDSPGSLYTVLQDFAEAKINLTKIESRPNPKISGEYVFYTDFEGSIADLNVKKTLNRVRKRVAKLKVLGCYAVD